MENNKTKLILFTWILYFVPFFGLAHKNYPLTISNSEYVIYPKTSYSNLELKYSGKTFDALTFLPIEGVMIMAFDAESGMEEGRWYTDRDGNFELILETNNSYVITFKKRGYNDFEKELITENDDKNIGNIYLEPFVQSAPSRSAFYEAKFPWPPPECNTSFEIPRNTFANCSILGDVNQIISNSLSNQNYPFKYMFVPGGFAVITQMEQYNDDGSIIEDAEIRWVDYPKPEAFGWSIDYFKSLIFPKKGHLRIFVFIVTNQIYSSSDEVVSKDEAAGWHDRGVNKLPFEVENTPYTEDYTIDLLVYEFEVPETDHKANQKCPTKFQAKEHYKRSGLKTHFKNAGN